MKDFSRKDVLISISIVVVTLVYFADAYIPPNLESFKVFGFEIGSFGFPDLKHLIYYSKMKFLILFLTITWYLTSIHWWKSAILVIVTIELFKLFTTLNSASEEMDEIDYMVSLPITLPIIMLLILVSLKINKFNRAKDLRSKIDIEIDQVFFELHFRDEFQIDSLKEKFEELKKNKNKKSYLKQLILIRDKFYSNE